MADENTQTDTEQTDDNQTAETDVTTQSDDDFMSETVDKIKETQKAILDKEGTDAGSDTKDDRKVLPNLAGTDIPDEFSDAAEASGMTKEDIIAMADKHTNEELIEMIPALKASLEDDGKDGDDEDTKQDDKKDKEVDNENVSPELINSITAKISKQLEEKFGATLEEINKFKADQEERANKQAIDTASKIFDKASEEFPVFGKTDELPKFTSGRLAGKLIMTSPAMKARLEVLRYADAFRGSGANIDDAMANALATYKGLHLEKELERKQVRDLKSRETKLSGARVGKETKKKYADSREEIIDEIKQLQRAAGV